jgi:hypothetical protein
MTQPIKTMTRDDFNRSSVGRGMEQCGLIERLIAGNVVYNEVKPFLVHEVAPAESALGNSFYILHGWRLANDKLYATISFGNGRFNDKEQKLDRHGDDCDRIDVQFAIPLKEGEPVAIVHVNKFRSASAEPQNEAEADAMLREVEKYMAKLENGEYINFQRNKIEAWTDPAKRNSVIDVMAESWARSRRDAPERETYPVRRQIATGDSYVDRKYAPSPD